MCVCVCVCVCVLGRGSVLSIKPVLISDAATYMCSADNFAERNASVQVTVHCEYSTAYQSLVYAMNDNLILRSFATSGPSIS